jgi:hypothetical protein
MGLLGTIAGFALGGLQAGGAALGAKSARKGAKKAAAAVQAQADKSNALAGDIYKPDRGALDADSQPGNPAGTQINSLLGLSGQPAQTQGFDNFRNSTGYQFRLGEGMNALNSGYAGSGVLQSGAALRGAQEYGQNFASNEFCNYVNLLDNQQRMGLAGATTQAGLGQNYVGGVSQNNMFAADGQANAALIRGQNNPFAAFAGSLAGTAQSVLSGGLKF